MKDFYEFAAGHPVLVCVLLTIVCLAFVGVAEAVFGGKESTCESTKV
jgi:hypothetical protein